MKTSNRIKQSRKKAGLSLDALGSAVGLTAPGVSKIEKGSVKRPSLQMLVKIADKLNDISILTEHCRQCPIRDHIFLKQFPDLNNIRKDPAVIAARLRKEMVEAAEALDTLSERFSDQDFKSRPDYMEVFEREMEQVADVKRGIEVLEYELIMSGFHSSGDIKRVYAQQQKKCERHGHHKTQATA